MKKSRVILGVAVAIVLCAVAATVTWLVMDGGEAVAAGSCTDATYVLEAEREGDVLEVSFELQSSTPGETWEIQVAQAGHVLLETTSETDADAEIDVDVYAGRDGASDFTATATKGTETCSAALSTHR